MPGTTPTYDLRYQTIDDPPAGDTLGADLAEDVEAQLVRLDAIVAGLSTATDWTVYTPAMQNIGSAAFSTQTGFWRRTWTKDVEFNAYFVVSGNGTGTGNVGFQLPTNPYRTVRQRFSGVRGDGGRLARFQAVTFASGTANWVDRIVVSDATNYLEGADLDAGDIYIFSGQYRES